jgi:hypothetical protein
MRLEDIRENTVKSKQILALARRYAKEAENLPKDNEKRILLEKMAEDLLKEAKELTDQAKEQFSKLS